jgi:hypothetical protein
VKALLDEVAAILGRRGIANAPVEADRIVRAAKASASADHERALGYVIGREVFMGVELIAAERALVPERKPSSSAMRRSMRFEPAPRRG